MSNARFSILQARAISDEKVSDAQFRTLAALGMYADKNGWCFPSLKTLGKDLNKSAQAVGRDTIALRKLGYLQVKNRYDSKTKSRHSNLYRLVFDFNVDDSTLSTPDVDTLSTPDVEVNDLSNDPINKDNSSNSKPAKIVGIESAIFAGRPVTEEDIDPAKNENDAIVAFEASYGINSKEDASGVLGWYTRKPKWTRLRKFVVEKYLLDKQYFEKYKTWRLTPYTRGAVSIAQVKYDPELFILSCAAFEEVVIVGNQTESPNKFEDGSAYV